MEKLFALIILFSVVGIGVVLLLSEHQAPVARGSMEVHGTEYQVGDNGKAWLQLVNSSGDYVVNGLCYIDIYTPDNEELVEHSPMVNFEHDGVYYYDFQAPADVGVYPVIARCYYEASQRRTNVTAYNITYGTAVDATFNKSYFINGIYMEFDEAKIGGVSRIDITLDFTNMSNCTTVPESDLTFVDFDLYAQFDSTTGDNISMYIYNFSDHTWIPLDNVLTEGPGFRSASSRLNINNLTEAGIYNDSFGGVRVKFNDTGLVDPTNSAFLIDQVFIGTNRLLVPEWQEVKGSSEIHVSDYINRYVSPISAVIPK